MDDWKLEPAHDIGLGPRERARDLRREAGLIETAGHWCWYAFVRAYLAACHRLRVDGAERIPREPPFILVSNHASHLDAMVLASVLPSRIRDRIFPIAAGDVFFETPLVGYFAAGMINALPMWRKNCGAHAMEALRERLVGEPCAYILFPEGGRSRDGAMKPFKAGLGMLVAGTSVPVVPCYLKGTFEALPAERRFPRWRRITMRVGEGMVFADETNNREGWKRIAEKAQEAVAGLGK